MRGVFPPHIQRSWDTRVSFLIFHTIFSDAVGLDSASLVLAHVWIIGTSEEGTPNADK